MPNKIIPELNYLLKEVEKHYGRPLKTSANFEALSIVIERDLGEIISASTLKRLWGYVSLRPTPRMNTLNVLSKFIGKRDFATFCQNILDDEFYVSEFSPPRTSAPPTWKKGLKSFLDGHRTELFSSGMTAKATTR